MYVPSSPPHYLSTQLPNKPPKSPPSTTTPTPSPSRPSPPSPSTPTSTTSWKTLYSTRLLTPKHHSKTHSKRKISAPRRGTPTVCRCSDLIASWTASSKIMRKTPSATARLQTASSPTARSSYSAGVRCAAGSPSPSPRRSVPRTLTNKSSRPSISPSSITAKTSRGSTADPRPKSPDASGRSRARPAPRRRSAPSSRSIWSSISWTTRFSVSSSPGENSPCPSAAPSS